MLQGSCKGPGNKGRRVDRNHFLSISTTEDKRWSDVIPPNSALTFAVVWDPEEGIVAFSGANLLDFSDADDRSPISPGDAYDNRSQVLTVGNSTIPMSENTATLAFFRENHEFLFASRTPLTLDRFRRTQTSSTLEGLDVYLRGSMLGKAHPYHRRYSFLKQLETEFNFDPRTSFANLWQRDIRKDYSYTITDEGFEEEPALRARDRTRQLEVNLCSAFSTTTTSTSRYISVEIEDLEDVASSSWSDMATPNTPGYSRLVFNISRPLSRRLRKRRPQDAPAPPLEVLQRPTYNHTLSPSPARSVASSKHRSLHKFVRSISLRWKEQWICADHARQ